jgi:MSHA biogenesis protein MshQ
MRYTGLNPNGINQVASGSVAVLVENTRVATFGTNTLQVTGSTILSSSVSIIGTETVNGSLIVTGSTVLSGSISTTGPIVANSNLIITGSTILSSSLAVIGSEVVNGSLLVTGSTTFSGSLTTTGPTIFSGSFTVVTGSGIEFQVTDTGTKLGNLSTDTHSITGSTTISGSFTVTGPTNYSNFGITYTTFQTSGSTLSAIISTASLYTASIATSQSIAFNAVVTGYGTGSRDTITGEIKTTIKRVGGNATLIGTPFRYINSDTTGSDINVGVSASVFFLSVTGSTSEPYRWFATITTQTV